MRITSPCSSKVSIRCLLASTAEPVGDGPGPVRLEVSIRCLLASTAEHRVRGVRGAVPGFNSLSLSEYSGTGVRLGHRGGVRLGFQFAVS